MEATRTATDSDEDHRWRERWGPPGFEETSARFQWDGSARFFGRGHVVPLRAAFPLSPRSCLEFRWVAHAPRDFLS